jgi:hypothetical protein
MHPVLRELKDDIYTLRRAALQAIEFIDWRYPAEAKACLEFALGQTLPPLEDVRERIRALPETSAPRR